MKNLFSSKIIILIAVFFPFLVSAQGRFIPCSGPDCNFCDIFELFNNIISFILTDIVPPIAILILIVSGLLYYFSAGDPGKVKTATDAIKATIVGLLIVYFGWSIVVALFRIIGVAGDGWFFWSISC